MTMRQFLISMLGFSMLAVGLTASAAAQSGSTPALNYVAGPPTVFATRAELDRYGFAGGPSDGGFGAIPAGNGTYTFFGHAGSSGACAGSPRNRGIFAFVGTLDHVTGSNGCRMVVGRGDAPSGWIFDANYVGGGQVIRFAAAGKTGWFMLVRGEVQWKNPSAPNNLCRSVPCYYASIGLAVSTDNGRTFRVAGEILQAAQAVSDFKDGGMNHEIGYGTLVVADAGGKHIDNPPPDPAAAYLYLFFMDTVPGLPGYFMGVARARYADVTAAVLSGDPHALAKVFRKYDATASDPWSQKGTSDTPDLSVPAGKNSPLWTDAQGGYQVVYDRAFDTYLTVHSKGDGIELRASNDLLHWSGPIGALIGEPGRKLWFPNLLGETGDPIIAGAEPRLYFSSFPKDAYPNWKGSVFESMKLSLGRGS
jgi:hypothetical protein